jgi:hypothetical protein
VPISIPLKWFFFVVFSGVMGAGVMMLIKAPPFKNLRIPAVVSTAIFVLGMTGFLVFGEPDLLQATLGLFTGK